MEKENDLVRIESEDGKTYDMLILKEFEYKNAKYEVLMETDSYDCNCDNECNDDCDCEHDCDCGNDCNCGCHENTLCLLEVSKDEKGNEVFKSITDEKLFDEVIAEADKVLYEIEDKS